MQKTLIKIRYWLTDFFAVGFLTFSILIFRILPPKALIFMAKIIGTTAFHFLKKYRERVIGNLSVAFGKEKDLNEIKRLAQECLLPFYPYSLGNDLLASPFHSSDLS